MNDNELKAELNLQRKPLTDLALRLGKLLQVCETLDKAALTSEHTKTVMEECIKLLGHDYLGPKAKPLVNAIHKACFKNAKNALEQSRKAEEQELTNLMPACYRPKTKTGKPTKE
jgi:hypothetical protein